LLAAKPRGVLESAGVLPAVKELFLSVVIVVFIQQNLSSIYILVRSTGGELTAIC